MKAILIVAVVLAGCGGGPCADRIGAYRARMSLRAGNGSCAPTIEAVVALPAANTGCVGTFAASEDKCEVTSNGTCPDGAGGTIQMTGKETWVSDASSGTAAMSLVSKSSAGSVTCQGSYDVTYTRL